MATKLVQIRLAALTRVEYSEVIEVPADMTDDELDRLLDQRYDEVDGGEYHDDPDFWERSDSCEVETARSDDKAEFRLDRDSDDGSFIVTKI